MDFDQILNFEKRTGVKDGDISEFERKVNDVEAAIKGLLDGSLKPEEVKVEGIESEEEKAEKERQRLERKRAYEEKEAKLREERKREERERWWAGVEIFKPRGNEGQGVSSKAATDEEIDKKAVLLNRYKLDYSRWNTWSPTDEATLAEAAEAQRLEEEARNKEFERNNAEFCNQFVTDMENRKKVTEKKQDSADISRLKGNRYFKAKAYDKALEFYMEALKESPFDAKTVNNIAQVYIKMKAYDDASEFLERTLYLEPINVKALSRKAFVLGEQGRVGEAVAAVQAALKVEPGNAELVAQARELGIIEAERAAEQKVKAALQTAASPGPVAATTADAASGAGVAPAADSGYNALSVVSGTSDSPTSAIDALLAEMRRFSADQESALNDSARCATIKSSAEQALSEIHRRDELKVYSRTSGLVDALAELCKALCGARSGSVGAADVLPVSLRLLAGLVDGQRASKLLLLDHRVLSSLKTLLQECGGSSSQNDVDATISALAVLHMCCVDDISVKARTAVIGDKQTLGQLAGILGNVSYRVSSSGKAASAVEVKTVELGTSVLKAAAFADIASSALSGLDTLAGASVVCSVASAMHMVRVTPQWPAAAKQGAGTQAVSRADVLELLVEVALGLSQVEALRAHFALVSPVAENNKVATSSSLCAEVVQVILAQPELEVNATAALMNACLEASTAVRRAVVEAGGGEIATAQLSLSDAERAKLDGVTLVRKAGLLGRLAGEEAVQKLLLRPERYRQVCRRLALPSSGTAERWQLDERAHYVRILANLTNPPADCLSAGMAENVLPSLLAILPTPRQDCSEITATSVTLVPHDLAPALVLGNAARCLMPYADVPAYAERLYGDRKLLGVEKLICSMASCPDMRVRKNIAILLAKGCRVPGVRERVTALRGMQMMIELQNNL